MRCADGSLYTGITVDLKSRLAAHNAGTASKYTRAHGPVELAWCKRRQEATAARKLEYALKQLSRRQKDALIAEKGDRLWRRLRRATLA